MESGAFLISKPLGITSSDVVTKIKWALINAGYAAKGFKIGHGGTLDPFAGGLLIVLCGEATKLADAYLHSKKRYTGTIKLGVKTDSGDLTGTITLEKPTPSLSIETWQTLADEFTNTPYFQTPPMYSAKKINGKALHELARQGVEVERASIHKQIFDFKLSLTPSLAGELNFDVGCESGTYIRVLAEDLAMKAGTVAHLSVLTRTHSSDLSLENARSLSDTLDEIGSKEPLSAMSQFVPLNRLGSHLPKINVSIEEALRIRAGVQKTIQMTLKNALQQFKGESHRYGLVVEADAPIALLEKIPDDNTLRLQRVFNNKT